MSDLHCPANLSSIAGESNSGLRDGRKSLFQNPSLLCIYANLFFVCDSGNASIRVIDISRLVSRKKNDTLFVEANESEDQDDTIPIARKYTITCTLSLISTTRLPLLRPFSICIGRKLLQDYPGFYVGGTTNIFKLTDVTINSSCKGRLQKLYPGPNSDDRILPVALTCYQEKLVVANGHAEQPCILVLHNNRGVLLRLIASPLLPSPSGFDSGLCLVDTHLFVSSSSHCIFKLPIMNDNEDVELYCGKPNEPGSQDGIVTSARFHSPHGTANMGSTLIVCDTGNKSVRLINNAGPLRKLSCTVVSPRSLQRGTKKNI